MSHQLTQNYPVMTKRDSKMGASPGWPLAFDDLERYDLQRTCSEPTPSSATVNPERDEMSSEESYDIVEEDMMPNLTAQNRRSGLRHSWSTADDSPPPSRPSSPRPSLPSSATSVSIYTLDSFAEASTEHTRNRPSVLRRLKSSVSSSSLSAKAARRPAVQLDDFRQPPEQPEKRFIDGSGVVIPGVCDRTQCSHPLAHFVSTFRLSEAIEYTTALADHGITYTDYCRLVHMLLNFLDAVVSETKRNAGGKATSWTAGDQHSKSKAQKIKLPLRSVHPAESAATHRRTEDQATSLNQLLADITQCWQARGLPVVVCVSSFSLFAPHRISEAHVQILHVPFASQGPPEKTRSDSRIGHRLSFIDPLALVPGDTNNLSVSWRRDVNTEPSTTTAPASIRGRPHRQQQSKLRDRSQPWPLWPNAIPSGKRQAMHDNADRYGADPYFRAWIRANINSRTTSSTYVKFMIEQENDPFVNKRLPYVDTPPRAGLAWDMLTSPHLSLTPSSPISLNRSKYEHNRRLEARRTVENGSRLRILRFGLRHPIFPPHNAEMAELGLSKTSYDAITSQFSSLHLSHPSTCPVSYVRLSWHRLRRRSADDELARAGAYIRQLNAAQRRVVWTLERIPGVYDKGRKGAEWEVSAWNGTCPLELLMDLERWGIVERRVLGEGEEGE